MFNLPSFKTLFILIFLLFLVGAFFLTALYPMSSNVEMTDSLAYTEQSDVYIISDDNNMTNLDKQGEAEDFTYVEDNKSDCEGEFIDAEFQGGEAALKLFIAENLQYPEEAIENNIEGTVYVDFVVDEKGKVDEVTVGRSAHEILDAEAVSIIKKMPDFRPAFCNGETIKTNMTIPVVFQIN
ncbi:MAG: energy transducer TonB [Bacteroidales bacterium]|nr:energy transducer TonB [Bacteroidales bacterium]